MFVSINQFYFFIQSVFIGVVTAFLYEPISFMKTFIKNVIIANVIDVLFAVVPFFVYLNLSLKFSLPCFRGDMFLGVVLGLFVFTLLLTLFVLTAFLGAFLFAVFFILFLL